MVVEVFPLIRRDDGGKLFKEIIEGVGAKRKKKGGGVCSGGFVGRGGNTCEVRETFGSSLWAV